MPEDVATSPPTTASQHQSYPVQSRSRQGKVGGVTTEVTTSSFADRILITISQDGKIGQWFQVALEPRDPSAYSGLALPTVDEGQDDDLLPLPHLNAQTLLGASTEERETVGQLYTTQIASSIMSKRPDETRVLLIGLGLASADANNREDFFDLLELVTQTI